MHPSSALSQSRPRIESLYMPKYKPRPGDKVVPVRLNAETAARLRAIAQKFDVPEASIIKLSLRAGLRKIEADGEMFTLDEPLGDSARTEAEALNQLTRQHAGESLPGATNRIAAAERPARRTTRGHASA